MINWTKQATFWLAAYLALFVVTERKKIHSWFLLSLDVTIKDRSSLVVIVFHKTVFCKWTKSEAPNTCFSLLSCVSYHDANVVQTCPISKSSIKTAWYEPQIHVPTISWRPWKRITITPWGQKNYHMKAPLLIMEDLNSSCWISQHVHISQ
jgi:hypothetical protein